MYLMVHRDYCAMETRDYSSKFMRQHSYHYDFNRRQNNDDDEDFGYQMSPDRDKPKGCIEHQVSKMDTLAGIAIKYGVEVADIKRMNGLVTDLQMFALKTLQIPPGRHPPSPCLANGSDTQGSSSSKKPSPPLRRRHSDLFDSFHSLKPKSSPSISPAMSFLQGYYGIKPANQKNPSEGLEMAVYQNGGSNYSEEDQLAELSPFSNPPLTLQRKSKSVANNLSSRSGQLSINIAGKVFEDGGSEKLNEKFIRWRQNSEFDLQSPTPTLLMEDNSSNSVGYSKITGKGLALRSSRTCSGVDSEIEKVNPIPINMPDSIVLPESNLSTVKKSSSTSSLHDQENSTQSGSSIWPTAKWSLKPDLQALSAAVITRPIFDGLPKPITGRKTKAALD